MLKPLALLLLTTPGALADDAILAEYWTDSGSLPPEFAWETSVTIMESGQLTLKHCKGYETDGPTCKTGRARVPPEALQAIRVVAEESGLIHKPARETDTPIVGGGLTGGVVYLDGAKVALLAQPAEPDVDRVRKVLAAIVAAIPPRIDRLTDPD